VRLRPTVNKSALGAAQRAVPVNHEPRATGHEACDRPRAIGGATGIVGTYRDSTLAALADPAAVTTPRAVTAPVPAIGAARIVFLCAQLDNGGAERHWADLLPALARRQIGVRLVALFGGGRALESLRADGVPVRELGRTGLASASLLPALLAEARAKPSALVSFGYNAHALGALFARITGTPHVVNWHRQAGWPMNTVETNAVKLAGRLGAGAIAVTKAQHPDLLALDFDPRAIRTVANGVGPRDPSHRTRERARLNVSPDEFVAVLVARLRPEKRIGDFVAAVDRASRSDPRIRGIVVGDGPMANELRELATARGAPVTFVGHDPEPTRYMIAANVVVLASDFEALPISLVEALSCGRPCVATDVGGVPEIVEDGRNGLLVPVGEPESMASALVRLSGDADTCARMGERSLTHWRERFSFAGMVADYSRLLTSVTGPPTRWPTG
jgi:glycosyltransferase involved in cell wall biosynthesis